MSDQSRLTDRRALNPLSFTADPFNACKGAIEKKQFLKKYNKVDGEIVRRDAFEKTEEKEEKARPRGRVLRNICSLFRAKPASWLHVSKAPRTSTQLTLEQ